MKIIQINAVNGVRSTGRIIKELANFLNDNGDEGYLAYSDGFAYHKGFKIGNFIDVKIHGLLSRVIGKQAYFSKTSTRKLLKWLDKIQPDVVHLHNLHGNYINLEMLLEYLSANDIPTVLTLHDCWFYTGKCCHYTIDRCFKWQTECFDCPRKQKDNTSWFFDHSHKMHRDKKELFRKIPRLAIIGVSDWVTNEARKSFLSSAKIMTRIYNWIDLEVFRPICTNKLRQKMGLDNKFIILGVASGWSNNKGLNKFIELAGQIPEYMCIMLVGNISSNINLPENIIHISETNEITELVEYYSMANVLLNLSLEETFGKVSAEALACGTPIIAYRSTANPELVDVGCGYILDEDDIKDVNNAIFKVQKNGKMYYSDNCVAFAKANFNMDDRIINYREIYQEISKKIVRGRT